jgi:competence protein ComEC
MRWALALRGRIWAPWAVAALLGQTCGAWLAVWIPGLVVVLGVGLALALHRRGRTLWGPPGAWLIVWAIAVLRAQALLHPPVQPLDLPMPRTLPPIQRLQVDREPEWSPAGHRFEALWLQTCPTGDPPPPCQPRQGRVQVEVEGREVLVHQGDVLRVPAFTVPPPAYDNPGARDLRASWQRQGLLAKVHVAHGERLLVEPRRLDLLDLPGFAIDRGMARIGTWRRRASAALTHAIPGPAGDVLAALALGDRAGNDPDLQDWLQATGTAHVIAVSGSHLALVVWLVRGLLIVLLRRFPSVLRVQPLERWLIIPCVLVAWLYALLTGAASSTLRAAWMATALLLGRASGRQPDLAESLGFALCVLLAWDPLAVLDVGLVLSILGVLGLAWAGMRPVPDAWPRWRRWLHEVWHASLGPSALTAPATLLAFGALPLVGALANLVVVPYAGVMLLPVALAMTALAVLLPVPWTAGWLPASAHWALYPLRWLVHLPRECWPLWHANGLRAGLAGLLVPLVLAALWHRGRWRHAAGLVALATALALGAQHLEQQLEPGSMRIHVLDVGHGDCTVLQFADGSTMVVDAGGFVGDDGLVGRLAVLPFLRRLGVTRIDRMVLTHAHPDHENGLLTLARQFPVTELWWNGQPAAGKEHAALLARLTEQGTRWRDFAGDVHRTLDIAGVTVRVLSPTRAPFAVGLGLNDNSLVLELQSHGHRLLLAGDIEKTTEAALVESGELRPVDVLKVPHHGSRTSSTPAFLATLRPGLAVAGARPWGPLPFPHAEVTERYAQAGVPLWTTAQGHVEIAWQADGVHARQGSRTWQVLP